MREKSYVSMEQKVCLVTGNPYNTDTILMDRRLKASMEANTITGWGISPEVQAKIDEGYVALVGIDVAKSQVKNEKILPENAWRTGKVAYLRRSVLQTLMPKFPPEMEWTFVDEEFMEELEKMEANTQK